MLAPNQKRPEEPRDWLARARALWQWVLRLVAELAPKGLYARAKDGQIKNFTGIDSPYEAPESPEIHVRTAGVAAEAAAQTIIDALRERHIIT